MAAGPFPAAAPQAADGQIVAGMDDSPAGLAALPAGGLPPGLAVTITEPDGNPAMLWLGGDRHARPCR